MRASRTISADRDRFHPSGLEMGEGGLVFGVKGGERFGWGKRSERMGREYLEVDVGMTNGCDEAHVRRRHGIGFWN